MPTFDQDQLCRDAKQHMHRIIAFLFPTKFPGDEITVSREVQVLDEHKSL